MRSHATMKGLAALLVLAAATGAHAQITMGNDFVKLYFNPTGDLIAPMPKGETPASRGIEYRPNTSGTYQEELAAGLTGVAEGWVLSTQNAQGTYANDANGLFLSSYGANNGSGNDLQRTFVMNLKSGPSGPAVLQLTQVVTLADTGTDADKVARFDVTLRNTSASVLNGLTYLRSVNPRQGLVGIPTPTQNLEYSLGSSSFFPGGISLLSEIPGFAQDDDSQRLLALASRTPGSRVNSFGSADANRLRVNSGGTSVASDGYYEWTGSGIDSSNATGSTISTDGPYGINLWFDSNVIGQSLAPGGESTFSFYYVLSGGKPASVPEPGTLAVVAAGLGAAGLILRRRKA